MTNIMGDKNYRKNGFAVNNSNKAFFNSNADDPEHIARPRLNALFAKAVEKPLVIVCAGAGYGKTRAVSDFTRKAGIATMWLQFSEQDNVISRFWETFIHGVAQVRGSFGDELKNLGFPDTEDKLKRYLSIRDKSMSAANHKKYLAVFDDFHLIENQAIIGFIGQLAQETRENRSVIFISRETPPIGVAGLQARGDVYNIQESDLNFTEAELSLYLDRNGLSLEPKVVREIYEDTGGWAFSMNLVARSLKKTPGYSGYAREAIKKNVFQLMETEVFNVVSEPLKRFLVCLSLVEHLSESLINSLARGDEGLLAEFRQQSAYIRYDVYMNAYLIHHLFLDFLRTKKSILTEEETRETYQLAAVWCKEHDYITDALGYYEKTGDYEAIVSIFYDFPFFISNNFALYALEIFRRAPEEAFLRVDFLAVMYLRAVISLWREQEFNALAEHFERKMLELPEESILRKHTLGMIYYFQGLARLFMSTSDGRYDFDIYFARMNECLQDNPIEPGKWLANNLGPWISLVGYEKQGARQRYSEASALMLKYVNKCLKGAMAGLDDLGLGEIKFYQGDAEAAKQLASSAADSARAAGQYETVHRALFYTMRIAFSQGKRGRAEQALKDIELLREEKGYFQRFITCDIALGWFYYMLRQPDMVPGWLKEKFSPYGHAFFPENFGNQMKARYHYMTKNFLPLLAYIAEMERRESILFGRVEMLAMEACVRYQIREKANAFAVLRRAYEAAASYDILMPFLELGKDMRTLTTVAMREPDCGIPERWLEIINKGASLYARYQAKIISEYEKEIGIDSWIPLSARETDVLHDLYAGLSRSEIAAKQKLSLSTVNMNVKSIFSKLHAQNVADVIRAAVERKLI